MAPVHTKPILLYNDECGVCRRIAHWVKGAAHDAKGEPNIDVEPIGDDPEALHTLNPNLGIWDAYATIHMLFPDGSMKLGGEAVAEVLRRAPMTKWFVWTFAIRIFGFRPFQALLNLAYIILAAVRPLFGCESCGMPSPWLRRIASTMTWIGAKLGRRRQRPNLTAHPASPSPSPSQEQPAPELRAWPLAP